MTNYKFYKFFVIDSITDRVVHDGVIRIRPGQRGLCPEGKNELQHLSYYGEGMLFVAYDYHVLKRSPFVETLDEFLAAIGKRRHRVEQEVMVHQLSDESDEKKAQTHA